MALFPDRKGLSPNLPGGATSTQLPDRGSLANDIIGGLLATQPGREADFARQANTLLSQPPNPLLLVRQLGFESRKVYLFNRTANGPELKRLQPQFDQSPETITLESFRTGYSHFGTPVICGMVLTAPSHRDPSTGQSYSKNSIALEVVLAEVENEKNIVNTPIQGRDESVTEYVNGGDKVVSVKGKLVGISILYPLAAVKKMVAVLDAKTVVEVESPYLNEVFGITQLVILRSRFWQEEGVEGEQMFAFTAKKESPL